MTLNIIYTWQLSNSHSNPQFSPYLIIQFACSPSPFGSFIPNLDHPWNQLLTSPFQLLRSETLPSSHLFFPPSHNPDIHEQFLLDLPTEHTPNQKTSNCFHYCHADLCHHYFSLELLQKPLNLSSIQSKAARIIL